MDHSEQETVPPTVPHIIDQDTRAAIGTIIMSASNIDDLLSLHMFNLASIIPSDGFLMIGQLAVSAKIPKIEYFLRKYATEESLANFRKSKPAIQRLFLYRNAFAHGVYQGMKQPEGMLIFALTARNYEPENGTTVQQAIGF